MHRKVNEHEVTCPYCGHKLHDSWELPDEGEEECEQCGKKYYFSRDISVSYESRADCKLNNEEHDFEWRETHKLEGAYFCKKCPEIKLKEKADAVLS